MNIIFSINYITITKDRTIIAAILKLCSAIVEFKGSADRSGLNNIDCNVISDMADGNN